KVEHMNNGKFINRLSYDNVNSAYSMNLHVGTNGDTELVTVEEGRIMPVIIPQEKSDQMNMQLN
ncbi:MAG TPA: hypothetical protein VN381_06325, partial [Anaerovoracaceae bacterium]|nr:hypothetical protein [Anaerovoracaceae bacterium]